MAKLRLLLKVKFAVEGEKRSEQFLLRAGRSYRIGSGKKADIRIRGEGVEKIHAIFEVKEDGSAEISGHSSGVIYVSGSKLKPQKARSVEAGDKIKLGDLGARVTLVTSKMYKDELKALIEQGDIEYPEGVVVLDDDENLAEDRLTDFAPEKKLKQNDDNDNSASEGGWLQQSGLDTEQQKKLFRLMGGKTKEDMELLNKRASQFDYSQVNREAEDDFYRGIELRKGKKHVGLGKQ